MSVDNKAPSNFPKRAPLKAMGDFKRCLIEQAVVPAEAAQADSFFLCNVDLSLPYQHVGHEEILTSMALDICNLACLVACVGKV